MGSVSKASKINAGAAQINITPEMDTQLAGSFGLRRPAEFVMEPIFARVLVLESNDMKVCIISLDLCVATREWCDKIRIGAEEKYGISKENVVVHVVHNHAAPSLGHYNVSAACNLLPEGDEWTWVKGGDDRYHTYVVEKTLLTIGNAIEKLQPANIGVCRGIDGRFAFNRRYIMRDGTVTGKPGRCNPEILCMESTSDPEVGVALITNDRLENIAVLLHHTCHTVHNFPLNYISHGWPGEWCKSMQDRLGSECVPLVINGFSGNVFHENLLDPDHVTESRRDLSDYKKMGMGLAQTSFKALQGLRYIENPVMKVKSRHIDIPINIISQEGIDKAREMLSKYPTPKMKDGLLFEKFPYCTEVFQKDQVSEGIDWEWLDALKVIDTNNEDCTDNTFNYEIQVFRIGDLTIVTAGGEPFVQGQLKIKLNSPARYTFIAEMSNYHAGYIPIKQAFETGGYETWGLVSRLHPDALELIVDTAKELLEEIFQ